jgi:hypothetical protein
MDAGRLVAGAALALTAGATAGVVARSLMYERANVSPETKRSRSTGNPQGDGYRSVFLPVLGAMGGVAALAGAHSKLGGGALAAGLGLAALGGAGIGMTIGYATGALQGSKAAEATWGSTIEEDADELFALLDVDRSGSLELDPDGRLPEYLTRGGYSYESRLRAADTDENGVVTRPEYVALLQRFDADGSGKLSSGEFMDMSRATRPRSYG